MLPTGQNVGKADSSHFNFQNKIITKPGDKNAPETINRWQWNPDTAQKQEKERGKLHSYVVYQQPLPQAHWSLVLPVLSFFSQIHSSSMGSNELEAKTTDENKETTRWGKKPEVFGQADLQELLCGAQHRPGRISTAFSLEVQKRNKGLPSASYTPGITDPDRSTRKSLSASFPTATVDLWVWRTGNSSLGRQSYPMQHQVTTGLRNTWQR